jgi:hypothetical protein
MAIHAPPAERLRVEEDSFNSAAAPNPLECPHVDKAYCETRSKIHKAALGVVAAAAAAASSSAEKAAAVLWNKDYSTLPKTMHAAVSTINKAYADGDDDKEIARVLAAYTTRRPIRSLQPLLLKVMESTFKHAAATLE